MEEVGWSRDVVGSQTPVCGGRSGWGITGTEKRGNQSPHQAPLPLGTAVQRPGPRTPAFEKQWALSLGAETPAGLNREDGGLWKTESLLLRS